MSCVIFLRPVKIGSDGNEREAYPPV
jgi:hypothetical protein